jgi:hypothetical protein
MEERMTQAETDILLLLDKLNQNLSPDPLSSIFLTIIVPLIAAFIGAFSSAFLFHKFQTKRENNSEKIRITNDFINEFFSKEFIAHRAALWDLDNKTKNEKVSIECISNGFIFPINFPVYIGPDSQGLNYHQHLTFYFGFLERLGHAIEKDKLNTDEIVSALKFETSWHSDLVNKVVKCCNDKSAGTNGMTPSFCKQAERVLKKLELYESEPGYTKLFDFERAPRHYIS